MAELSLDSVNFADWLQFETNLGHPTPRAMRRVRNLLICTLIERDLQGKADLNEVVATMSRFADFVIQTHLAELMVEMVALHGEPIGEQTGESQELIVLGMGKLGGGELNVSSDIDLIFVYSEDGETQADLPTQRSLSNHEFFVRLGRRLITAISDIVEDGFTFRVDMALRPNGGSGPLVASMAMLEQYLLVQGREWERYAWVKARPITGKEKDIADLEEVVQPFVFRRYLDFGVIDAIRNMHAQIRAEVMRQERRYPERKNDVKLGRGGIREIEFLAQSFQLIRGGRDATLRDRSTRETLKMLAEKELLSHEVVNHLLDSYYFLRNLEHRLQYLDDAQTHTLPRSDGDQIVIAKMMGYEDLDSLLAEIARHRRYVEVQFDAIFSDKSETVASNENLLDFQAMRSQTDEDWQEFITSHLQGLGFIDAENGARRLLSLWRSSRVQALPESSRDRLASLCNAALPLIIESGKTHAATLGRLVDFFAAVARRASYLSLLIEYPQTFERVVRMMDASDWAAKFLTNHPILLDELLNDLLLKTIPDWQEFSEELTEQLEEASDDTEAMMNLLRDVHHAQLFHLLAYDLQGGMAIEWLADHLSTLADVLVAATIQAVWQTIPNRHCEIPKFAVIAYGKLGGKELSYASDLDIVFLYDDDHPDAPMLYARLAQRFITWMTSHTSAGILFDIDTALRPDGASGLLVSRISAFEHYQKQSAWTWEHQALTRARFCSGDAGIGARFEVVRKDVICQARDHEKIKQDVLAMRKKMRDALLKEKGSFDLKHSAGGMVDIEFMVQYLVLLHASNHPVLAENWGNIALLQMCEDLGLIPHGFGARVGDAYRVMRKRQHLARLQGEDSPHVSFEELHDEAQAAQQLWATIFGD